MSYPLPLSLLDFCFVFPGETPAAGLERAVRLGVRAEELGFHRIWWAEHHNQPTIASSAPMVMMTRVGSVTSRIRLGAGGVMLPNHSPYIVAEQYGSVAAYFPGRVDLGFGRAPGTNLQTLGQALRRDPQATSHFPTDLAEIRGYLAGTEPYPGVRAYPGDQTNLPVVMLSSSPTGAALAAELGLPYSFASHIVPQNMEESIPVYREKFQPSAELAEPYVIGCVNVTLAETDEEAQRQAKILDRRKLQQTVDFAAKMTDEQLDVLGASPQGAHVVEMRSHTPTGSPATVAAQLADYARRSTSDELMVLLCNADGESTVAAVDLLAQAWEQAEL